MLDKTHTLLGLDGQPICFTDPKSWIALLCYPGKEQQAADWLKNSRLYAYWPCFAKDINSGTMRPGSRRRIFSAVMPGYLFLAQREGDTTDPWAVVRQVPGLTGYVRDHFGAAARITVDDIERIRLIEAGLNLPPKEGQQHQFKAGDKVAFKGELLGRWPNGRVVALANSGQISVEIRLLGQSVQIWTWPHQIARCS